MKNVSIKKLWKVIYNVHFLKWNEVFMHLSGWDSVSDGMLDLTKIQTTLLLYSLKSYRGCWVYTTECVPVNLHQFAIWCHLWNEPAQTIWEQSSFITHSCAAVRYTFTYTVRQVIIDWIKRFNIVKSLYVKVSLNDCAHIMKRK